MTRKCSHCSNNGHNSRTCPNRGVKLFGVRLTDHGSIRKSVSMGNLTHYMTPQNGAVNDDAADHHHHPSGGAADGYASEDFVAVSSSSSRDRKKGVPWTEEEHRMFLLGLQKLGKGDWRGIARTYVITRTPTQVASHAQKYFIRQSNVSRRKRRSSLFDLVPDEAVDTPLVPRDFFSVNPSEPEKQTSPPSTVDEECESMESANSNETGPTPSNPEGPQYPYPYAYPAAYVAPLFSLPVPFWPPVKEETHQVVKPTAVHSKSPINVDELVGMSKLSLAEESNLSLKLVEGSANRPSAFHANPPSSGSSIHVI